MTLQLNNMQLIISSVNYGEGNVEIKQEPPDPSIAIQNTSRVIQPVPIKLEDLDGIGKFISHLL